VGGVTNRVLLAYYSKNLKAADAFFYGTEDQMRRVLYCFLFVLLFSVIVCALVIAGKAASTWLNGVKCHVPSRLAYNLACVRHQQPSQSFRYG
jgi:hypothetical protein